MKRHYDFQDRHPQNDDARNPSSPSCIGILPLWKLSHAIPLGPSEQRRHGANRLVHRKCSSSYETTILAKKERRGPNSFSSQPLDMQRPESRRAAAQWKISCKSPISIGNFVPTDLIVLKRLRFAHQFLPPRIKHRRQCRIHPEQQTA